MGIRRIDAPKGEIPKQVTEDDDNYIFQLAGSRKTAKVPQRQRGIWSFLVSPFVFSSLIAVQSALAKGHSAPGEEEDAANNQASHANGVSPASPNDPSAATSHSPDDRIGDQTGSSGYPVARVQSTDAAAPEELKKSEMTRNADPAPTIAPPDGGGGGGSDDRAQDDSSSDQNGPGALSDSALTSLDQPHGTSVLPIVIDAGASGIHVGIATGAGPALANILPAVDLGVGLNGTLLNLKDVVGFDVHLGNDGSFVDVGLGDMIDAHLSIPQTVNAVVNSVAELPIINISAPNVLDELFGNTHGASTTHLTSTFDTHGILTTLDQHATTDLGVSTKLSATIDAALLKVDTSTSLSGAAELPHFDTVATTAVANTLSDVLGHTGVVSAGSAIQLPPAVPITGDALFSGNHYTDYHVALQSTFPGSSSVSPAPSGVSSSVETVVAQLPDALPHDTAHGQTETPTAAPHPDQSANQLLHSLDDLSIRSGAH